MKAERALPERVVNKMLSGDLFSQWLGIELVETSVGTAVLRMTIRKEMLNGFGIAHGGIAYSLADSALAFASNSHGLQSMSIETSISHTKKINEGDVLTATATEKSLSRRIGIYEVDIRDQRNEVVALFKGTVYRTEKEWKV